MKKLLILAAVTLMLQSTALYAVDNAQDDKPGAGNTNGMDMSMMKNNMQNMMEQMEKIHAADDPAKRKQLMHEHMQKMHKGMKMMRSMGGNTMAGMAGDKKGGNMKMAKGMNKNMSSMDMGERHQMMEQRMDMMQMMMEQMMGQMSEKDGAFPKSKRHDHNKMKR